MKIFRKQFKAFVYILKSFGNEFNKANSADQNNTVNFHFFIGKAHVFVTDKQLSVFIFKFGVNLVFIPYFLFKIKICVSFETLINFKAYKILLLLAIK